MTVPLQTLVSCLFDLDRRERTGRRPVQFFFEHGRYVLGLELPLVLYLEPDLVEWVTAVRERAGLSHLTRVVSRSLEDLRLHPDLDSIRSLPTFLNSQPDKDTALHQLIEWSKFDLLDEVMADNPFGSDHFGWVDLGLGYVAHIPARFPPPTESVGVLQMQAVAPDEIQDRFAFYQYERGRIAGGFFRGSPAKLSELGDAFRIELSAALAQGIRPNEQSVLSYVSAARPDLFEFHYGSYPSILANWDLIRGDADTVLLNLAHCRAHGLQEQAGDIAARIVASVDAGVLTLSKDQADLLRGRVGAERSGSERPRASIVVPDGEALRPGTIALCMIVRDEGAIIERCIESVRGIVTRWVICDTGSTDDTVTRLAAALEGIPGELHHRPWHDFATNRTELLRLARGTADYLLLLDADMTLSQEGPLAPLTADAYLVRQHDAVEYWIPRLIRGGLEWRYEGATHEYLVAPEGSTEERMMELRVLHHGDGGARSNKLERDRELLERQLAQAPQDERTHFYLAQTYEGLGDTRRAIDLYRRRGELGGFEEEAWYATYRAACLEAEEDWDRGVAALLAAWERRPSRVEPLYELARGYRFRERHELAHLFATRALELSKPPDDLLFLHYDAYEWGVLFEWSISAYWVGRVGESLEACDVLLERELPADIVPYVRHNRRVALTALGLTESGHPRWFPIAVAEDLRRLDELVGETRIGEIVLDIESHWPQFNPSIAADGDGFRMLVRTANYFEENGAYHCVDGPDDTTIRTQNYLVTLNSGLAVTGVREVQDLSDHAGRYESPVIGFEDCRLFEVDGCWYASATSREGNPDHRCEQVLLAFDGAEITSARLLTGPDPMRDEKNWMPVSGPDGLQFVYSCDPTVVLRCDPRSGALEVASEHPGSAATSGFRGGSQGVAVENGTVFVIHEVTVFGSRRVYSHRFVLFNETWELTAASPPFCLLEATVEFCAGLARSGDQLVLSFGARDESAYLAVVDLDRVIATLGPLTDTAWTSSLQT